MTEKVYHKPNDGAATRLVQRQDAIAPVVTGITDGLVKAGMATAEQAASTRMAKPARMSLVRNEAEIEPDEAEAKARAALQARVAAIVDGIYFGLPDTIYHAVPALGSGSINDLIVSPGTFWCGSWLDPDRPELDEEQTAAQLLGKAYHCARLEPDDFDVRFVREPSKDDFPKRGMLTSDTAVKAALKDLGEQQTFTGETAEERAERLLDLGYDGTIWPLEYARWEHEVLARDPVPTKLKAQYWDDILIDMERFQRSEVSELVDGGAAEVSIFWTDEHGLRCKARFDKLLPNHWVDFKTFANPNGKVLSQAIADAFRYSRYYVQAVHYRDAAEAVRTDGLKIIGDATDDQRKMIAEIQARPTELACWYVFQEKGGIPNLVARQFKFVAISDPAREAEMRIIAGDDPVKLAMLAESFGRKTAIHRKARMEIEQAKQLFVLYSQTYRPGEPWAPIEPMGTIDDDDFAPYFLENG